jgi:hypothetical protein
MLALAAVLLAAPPEPWELLKYAPAGANAVLGIDVQKLLASPRAKTDGWAKLTHTEYLAGAVPVHPAVRRVVAVNRLHPAAPGLGGAVALLPTTKPIDMATLPGKVGGEADTVGGGPAVRAACGGYFLPLTDTLLAAVWGGDKQQVAGWARAARASTAPPLSRDLTRTFAELVNRHHIVAVVDVDELFPRPAVAAAVQNCEALKGGPDVSADLTGFLSGLSTVALTADVADRGLVARLTLTSRTLSNKLPADALKAFLVEQLGRAGAPLEDLPAAMAKVSGRTATLDFLLSDPELARLTHLFLPPLPSNAEAVAVAPAGPTGEATARYLKLIDQRVDGLRRKTAVGEDYLAAPVWYDAAANALLTTSVLGVDPAAVEYAFGTAARLRQLADSLRGQPLQLAALEGQAYYVVNTFGGRGFFGFWNPYAFTRVDTNLPQVRAEQAAVVERDAANRAKVWAEIAAKRSDIQGALVTKYGAALTPARR